MTGRPEDRQLRLGYFEWRDARDAADRKLYPQEDVSF